MLTPPQYAVIRNCVNADFLRDPQHVFRAFCYIGASSAIFHQTFYFAVRLHIGYGYADAGGGAFLTKNGHLALDGIAVVGASSKHQLVAIRQYLAIAGIDENVVIVCW